MEIFEYIPTSALIAFAIAALICIVLIFTVIEVFCISARQKKFIKFMETEIQGINRHLTHLDHNNYYNSDTGRMY